MPPVALELHSLDRGAGIAAVTDAEEILRYGRARGSRPHGASSCRGIGYQRL